jgi:hypothetical protein
MAHFFIWPSVIAVAYQRTMAKLNDLAITDTTNAQQVVNTMKATFSNIVSYGEKVSSLTKWLYLMNERRVANTWASRYPL